MHGTMTNDGLTNGYFKVVYRTAFAEHTQTIPLKITGGLQPGTPFGTVEVANGNDEGIQVCVDEYAPLLAAMLPPQANVAYFDLWSKPTETSNPQYIYTFDVDLPGTLNLPGVAATQFTFTYRTNLGGVGRFVLLDVGLPVNRSYPSTFAGLPQPYIDFRTWFTSAQNFFVGRDNGKPMAILRALTKTNDKLRRKYGIT